MSSENVHLKSGPDQISYVTSDLARAKETLAPVFGVERFFQADDFRMTNQQFRGAGEPLVFSVALAWTGNIFLEIIQPHTRDVIYSPYLKPDEFTLAPHHIAFAVEDWDQLQKQLQAEDRQLSFSGEVEGLIQSGYWDGRNTVGQYVEYYAVTAAGEESWNRIKRGDF